MQNKSQTTASATPVFSLCSVVAACQLRLEISAYLEKRRIALNKRSLLNKLRELLHYGLATLLISAVFLACSWLFLVQLAEHGW